MIRVFRSLLKPLASLRLTVTLLALSIFLIFAGTWAQIDMGIWTTLKTYFRSFFVLIPFQIFLPRDWRVPGGIPYPGGYIIGGLLMINLIAAHAVRFKLSRRRAGIILIHIGIIMLLGSELVTGILAVENNMSIDEGQTVSFAEDIREVELAFLDTSNTNRDIVVAIPQSRLRQGNVIRHETLPFEVRVDAFYDNAELFTFPDDAVNVPLRATRGVGADRSVSARSRAQVSGVDQNEIDLPVALVTLTQGDRALGTWLVSLFFLLMEQPERQEFVVDGKQFRLELRYKRDYKPYQVRLLDFRHDRYLGTETPKNFSSRIQLVDTANNVDREVLIYMNHPLRYRGETFYQASFKKGDAGTVLQVVRNPGWLLPYIACGLGALGMMLQFGMHLTRFVKRSRWA